MNLGIDVTGLVLPERVEMTGVSEDGRSADFVIEPLERGFGHTLGNPVRRVLLSSLPGAAVWGFRISGVVHEHQTIPSVIEDVHQVIQNLKSLVVSLDDGVDKAVVEIKAAVKGPVTAADARTTGSVTIHNPDHRILTLEDDLEIVVELSINKGRGYRLADQHEMPEGAAVDLVRIDSIYSPVLSANFRVEETRVGQRTDFDRLTLHVETDGSITPEAAVRYAAELVREHLLYMRSFDAEGMRTEPSMVPEPVPEHMQELLATPIQDLAELQVTVRNSLQRAEVATVGDLAAFTEEELRAIDKVGPMAVRAVAGFLDRHGLRLGTKTERRPDGRLFFAPGQVQAQASR